MSTNTFVNLAFLGSNGAGAAADVSQQGATKTIIVGGTFVATVTIEYSTEDVPTIWAPLPTGSFVNNGGRVTVELACNWMRAVTSGFKSGTANIDVGGPYAPAYFLQMPDDGSPLDISLMPPFKTIVVDVPCILSVSEDGTSYSQVAQFAQEGAWSGIIVGQFAKLSGFAPLTPVAWLGAAVPGVDAEPGNGTLAIQAAGLFTPAAPNLTITSQSGQFASTVYTGVGIYTVTLTPIPGVTSADQVIPTVTPQSNAVNAYAVATTTFVVDAVVIAIHMLDGTNPTDKPFYMHVDILAP